jgi:DNA-binding NarL/FixJ family response regulator
LNLTWWLLTFDLISFKKYPMKVSITSRELEILRKSADGLSIQQIASDMKVSQQIIVKSQKELMYRTGSGSLLNALQTLAKRGFVLREEAMG